MQTEGLGRGAEAIEILLGGQKVHSMRDSLLTTLSPGGRDVRGWKTVRRVMCIAAIRLAFAVTACEIRCEMQCEGFDMVLVAMEDDSGAKERSTIHDFYKEV